MVPKAVEIPLTKGYVAIVDAEDFRQLSIFKWHAKPVFRADGSVLRVYASRAEYLGKINGAYKTRQIKMHREIMGHPDSRVDHHDGDGLNNRRMNLRCASHAENMANRRKSAKATSRFKGVYWYPNKSKWHASITCNGRRRSLGYHTTQRCAALAYNRAAVKLQGQFAVLNEVA